MKLVNNKLLVEQVEKAFSDLFYKRVDPNRKITIRLVGTDEQIEKSLDKIRTLMLLTNDI